MTPSLDVTGTGHQFLKGRMAEENGKLFAFVKEHWPRISLKLYIFVFQRAV